MSDNLLKLVITTDSTGGVTGIRNVTGAVQELESKTSGIVSKLKSHWLGIAATIAGASYTVHKAWGYAEMAAAFEEQKASLNALAGQYNTTADSIISDIKRASAGLIAMDDAARIAGMGLVKNLRPDQLIELAGAAETLSNISGEKVPRAFENLVGAIALGRERALEASVGIIDLNAKFGDLVNQMNDAEKASARYEIVMELVKNVHQRLGPSIDSTSDKMDRLKVTVHELELSMGTVLIRTMAGAMGLFQELASSALMVAAGIFKTGEAIGWLASKTGITKKIRDEMKAFAENMKINAGAAWEASKDLAVKGIDNFEAMISKSEDLKRVSGNINQIADSSKKAGEEVEKLNDFWFEMLKYQAGLEKDEGAMIKALREKEIEAHQWLTDKTMQLTLSEFDYKKMKLLEEYQLRADVIGWTEDLYQTFTDNLKKIDDEEVKNKQESEKMKAKITEDYALEQQKEYEKLLFNMENFFEDVFVGRVKNIWQTMLDWMRGIFARFVAKLAAEKIVIPIIAQIIPTGGAAAAQWVSASGIPLINPTQSPEQLLSMGATPAGGTGVLGELGSSISSLAGLVGDIGGTMMGSISSMENIVNSLGGATEGVWNVLNTVTPFLPLLGPLAMGLSGNYGGAIGGALGFGGSLALGATLGSIVPGIGTIVGSIIGTLVGKLFEDKEEPRIKIDWKGFFNVEDQDTELGEAQRVIENRFSEIRRTLLDFARDAGLETSRFFQEWKSDWKKLKDEGDVQEAVNKWISQYVSFVLPRINFEKFRKEGEELAATIDRIITAISQIKGTFESFDTYISAIKGSSDEILTYKKQLEEVTNDIKEVRKALRTATDPSDAITYANALKEAIYSKYMLEKNLIENLSAKWDAVISSVDSQINDLISGASSPQTAFERMSSVRTEMEKMRELYLGAEGVEKIGYAARLQEYIADYMGLAQEAFQRPSSEYKAIYDEMMGWLQAIKEDALEEKMDELGKIIGNKTVDEYLAKLQERAVTQLENISALLEKVLNKLLPGVKGYQTGGYAATRQLAWIAEREPEWVIPQSKMGSRVGNQTVTINNNIVVSAEGKVDEKILGESIAKSIFFQLRFGKGRQIIKAVMQYG
jgi:hypothetical protein